MSDATLAPVAILGASLSSTYTPGNWHAANCIDGETGRYGDANAKCFATRARPAGLNWAAVELPTGTAVGRVHVFNRHDQPAFRHWVGTFDVWLGAVAGDAASPSAIRCGAATYDASHEPTAPYVLDCRGASLPEPAASAGGSVFVTIRQTDCPSDTPVDPDCILVLSEIAIYWHARPKQGARAAGPQSKPWRGRAPLSHPSPPRPPPPPSPPPIRLTDRRPAELLSVEQMTRRFCASVLLSGCLHLPNASDLHVCAEQLAETGRYPAPADFRRAHEILERHSLLVIGDSTLYDKVMYLQRTLGLRDACAGGPGVCFHGAYEHMCDIGGSLPRRDFDVLLWNAGLHYLHLQPLRTGLRAGDYAARLARCASRLRLLFPRAQLVYKHTNRICSARFDGPYATAVAQWRRRPPSDEWYSMQFDEVGVATLLATEARVLSSEGWALLGTGTQATAGPASGGGSD